MKTKHIISIVLGVLLLVAGLVLLLMRNQLAIDWVGRDVYFKEVLFGGGSTNQALTMIVIGSVMGLISGCILLIFGLVFGLKTMAVISPEIEKPKKKVSWNIIFYSALFLYIPLYILF